MADPRKVLAEALALPVRERLRIARALLMSINSDEEQDVAEAWVAELERRSASVEDGAARFISAAAVHAHVREALEARRASHPAPQMGSVQLLPGAVDRRLQALLDRQDGGQALTPDEHAEAEGLVELADRLTLLRLRISERSTE